MNDSHHISLQNFCMNDAVANEVEIESTESDENKLEKTPIQSNTSQPAPKRQLRQQIPFFEEADYSNGALYEAENYCWSQTATEIEIHVRLPVNISAKNIKVFITSTSIQIVSRLNYDTTKILSGTLSEKCKSTEAMWTITAENKLNINIDKQRVMWWKKLFEHEPDIDVNQIDCSRPIDELPEETQTEINKIQWDEQQKLQGNLTSGQLKQHEMLRKSWNAKGSPFQGTPFDPSIVQFDDFN